MARTDVRDAAEALFGEPPPKAAVEQPLGIATARRPGDVWSRAKTPAELLDAGAVDIEWLLKPLVARGAITEIYAPRGTGKSVVMLARMVELSRTGIRVLYLDRDNSPATLRK